MNALFDDLIKEGWVIIYMDNILIFSKDLEEHHILVKKVLQRLEEEDLFLKPEKCFFEKPSIEYIGMIISQDMIQMDPAKLSTVLEWPTPKCVKDVQSFLRFGNFYRRFIQGFANITAPLTSLTRKDITWHWDDNQQTAFETLKQRFTLAPILLMPDFSKPFCLETDASDYDYGAIYRNSWMTATGFRSPTCPTDASGRMQLCHLR